jgi:hypothetical protein
MGENRIGMIITISLSYFVVEKLLHNRMTIVKSFFRIPFGAIAVSG